MSRRLVSFGILATAAMVALAPTAALAGPSYGPSNTTAAVDGVPFSGTVGPQAAEAFPSATSTVIGSTGFIDGEQVGYFWSASRGDSVAETFSGPAKIKKAILKLDVVQNFLSNGAHTDWTLSIDGTDVGSFVVNQGETGPITKKVRFPKLTGGSYDVKIRMTNEVAGGEGSITLRYAGDGPHSITLKRK